MATLYVENMPESLHKALQAQAKKNHRSMAAEVRSILELFVVTPQQRRRRKALLKHIIALRAKPALPGAKKFDVVAELRKDRRSH